MPEWGINGPLLRFSTKTGEFVSALRETGLAKENICGAYHPRKLERLREPGFEEFAQLRGRPELRDGFEFLEGRRERIG